MRCPVSFQFQRWQQRALQERTGFIFRKECSARRPRSVCKSTPKAARIHPTEHGAEDSEEDRPHECLQSGDSKPGAAGMLQSLKRKEQRQRRQKKDQDNGTHAA